MQFIFRKSIKYEEALNWPQTSSLMLPVEDEMLQIRFHKFQVFRGLKKFRIPVFMALKLVATPSLLKNSTERII